MLGNYLFSSVIEWFFLFEVFVLLLLEEDRFVMLLDEVIRKEVESENWSLNFWNSGSDLSIELFVFLLVWLLE